MADPLWRRELDGYIRRHEADRDAHGPMQRAMRQEIADGDRATDLRLSAVERFTQRLFGGLLVLAALLGSGAVATIIELSVHK